MRKGSVAKGCWERLQKDAVSEIETSGMGLLSQVKIVESIAGDPSFTTEVAWSVMLSVIHNDPLNARERLWLATVLGRLANDQKAANALSGKKTKGAPKKGGVALKIAQAVFREIFEGGATSVEEAWVAVAQRQKLDQDTVRKYWTKWKPIVARSFNDALTKDGAESFDLALKEMIKNNKAI